MTRLLPLVALLALHASLASARARVPRQVDGSFWWLTSTEDPPHSTSKRSVVTSEPPLITETPEGVRNNNPVLDLLSNANSDVTINNIADLAALFGGNGNGGSAADQCECVPYYQCNEGSIITNGEGLIDIRFGSSINDTTETTRNSHSECASFLEVCCTHPDNSVVPIPGPIDNQYVGKCGRRNPGGVDVRITGFEATKSQFGEFPWMAAVLQTEFAGDEEVNLYVCGGSLIYDNVVLTAAHCVQKWSTTPGILKVRLGEWDTQETYEQYTHVDRRVAKVITHAHFHDKALYNDFALLVLETPVTLSPHIDTICLPDQYVTPVDTSRCIVTGWGKDRFGREGEFQNVLKKVTVPLVSNDVCQIKLRTTRLGKYFKLHSSFNCAGGESDGQDACKGDGGSPLVCPLLEDPNTYVQMGIVAWGIGCGEPGIPGVYADVSAASRWIHEQLVDVAPAHGNIV